MSPTSNRDLERFLRHKNALGPCPFCGVESWQLDADSEFGIEDFYEGLDVGKHLPIALVICKSCGFVRPHVVEVVERNRP